MIVTVNACFGRGVSHAEIDFCHEKVRRPLSRQVVGQRADRVRIKSSNAACGCADLF